jgi:hypothetical protein
VDLATNEHLFVVDVNVDNAGPVSVFDGPLLLTGSGSAGETDGSQTKSVAARPVSPDGALSYFLRSHVWQRFEEWVRDIESPPVHRRLRSQDSRWDSRTGKEAR